MSVHEERIVAIRFVRIRQLFSEKSLLLLTHRGQLRRILLVQSDVADAEGPADPALQEERHDNGDLPRDVSWCFFALEGLGSADTLDEFLILFIDRLGHRIWKE